MNKLYRSGVIKKGYFSDSCEEYIKQHVCDIKSNYYSVSMAKSLKNAEGFDITRQDKVRLERLVKNGYWWVSFK